MAPSEFLELFHPHSEDLRRFLVRKLGCAEAAADLFQETWLRIIKLDPRKTIENPRALLFRIATNLTIDHQRKSAMEARHIDANGLQETIPDRAPSVETEVFSKQQLMALRAAIVELPPKRRQVFLMLKHHHMTYTEVAAALGVSESTVVNQMVKALKFCKARVQNGGELF